MKKNIFKIVLDITMAVLFLLMFRKQVISMDFHEIGGLFIFALFTAHLILNYKWVIYVTKKLFSKSMSVKSKINWIINFLLLISFILIVISGIFISKTLFRGLVNGGFAWKQIHYSASAFALVLTGIHLGLNWGFVMGMFKKLVKMPAKLAKPLTAVALAVVLSFGAYGIATTSFARWIAEPFVSSGSFGVSQRLEAPNGKLPNEGFNGEHTGKKDGSGQGEAKNQKGEFKPGSEGSSVNIGGVFGVIGIFSSIMAVFAVLTYYINKLALLLKKKKQDKILSSGQ